MKDFATKHKEVKNWGQLEIAFCEYLKSIGKQLIQLR